MSPRRSRTGSGRSRRSGVSTGTVLNTAVADKLLQQRIAALDDTRPALRAVAKVIRSEYRQQFRSGEGWAPLSDAYAARKLRQGRGRAPLFYTGTLAESLSRAGAPFARETVTRELVEVKTTDPVANLLRGGTKRMPARDPGKIDKRAVSRRARDVILVHLAAGGV